MKDRASANAINSPLSYQLGAVIFKGGKIISSGYNSGWVHAEHSALKKLKPNRAKGADILVVRVNKTGLTMAKPCDNCQLRLRKNGIKRVFYTNANGEMEIMKLRRNNR